MNLKHTLQRALGAVIAPLLVATSLLASAAFAEQPASPALWKLSDADSNVYLFGTVHILDPNISWHSQAVDDAFRASDILMLEVDSPDQPTPELQMLIQKYAFNKPGVTLSSLLSEDASNRIIEALVSFGVPQAQATAMRSNFEQLRPWFVGVQLGVMQIQSRGGDASAGVEKILKDAAAIEGHKLQYLETMEQQLGFFANLPQEKEVQMLEEGLVQMIEQPDVLDNLVTEWRVGNADEVGRQMQAAMTDPVVYKALLTDRNQNWANQIKTIMDGSGNYFIAVGTGHLAGAGSVQEYLSALGLEATRVQ